MPLRPLTAPTKWPVSLAQVKEHLEIEPEDRHKDLQIQGYLDACCKKFDAREGELNRPLMAQAWALDLDGGFAAGFDDPEVDQSILLPLPPVTAVTAVKYRATDGTLTTLSSAAYDVFLPEGRIAPVYGTSWPATRDQRRAVTIEYTCGHTLAADVPPEIVTAILLWVGHLYANREAVNVGNITSVMPMGVRDLVCGLVERRRIP